jgi:hypothetical protein
MVLTFMDGLGGKMAPSYTCGRFHAKTAPTLQRAPVFLMLARLADEQGDQYDDGQWNAQQQQEDGTHGRLLDLYDR